jgi:hypothetical protein
MFNEADIFIFNIKEVNALVIHNVNVTSYIKITP